MEERPPAPPDDLDESHAYFHPLPTAPRMSSGSHRRRNLLIGTVCAAIGLALSLAACQSGNTESASAAPGATNSQSVASVPMTLAALAPSATPAKSIAAAPKPAVTKPAAPAPATHAAPPPPAPVTRAVAPPPTHAAPAPVTHAPPPPPPPPSTCGAPKNPYGYNFCGSGGYVYSPPSGVCTYFHCIDNFSNGHGYMVECHDGTYSMSGGIRGACSYHEGEERAVDS
jgi:hypothetical protein